MLFLNISQNSQQKTCATVAQLFPCKFCEIFKSSFYTEHLRATPSVRDHALTKSETPKSVPYAMESIF